MTERPKRKRAKLNLEELGEAEREDPRRYNFEGFADSIAPGLLEDVTKVPSKTNRTRFANGRVALPTVDGRTYRARRIKETYAFMVEDVGGFDRLTEARRGMLMRTACLQGMAEEYEKLFATHDPQFSLQAYIALTKILHYHYKTIGLERDAKSVENEDLDAYINKEGE